MHRSRSLGDVLREAARMAQTLPRPEKEETVGAMVGMAYHYLEKRFGTVPAALEQHIAAADAQVLGALMDRALEVDRVGALLPDNGAATA